jgi:hypothetical protein
LWQEKRKEKFNGVNVILYKKITFKEVGCVVLDWIHLADSSEHSNESLDSTNAEKSCVKALLFSQEVFYGAGSLVGSFVILHLFS